jgi:anti-anti-sigma regulatory factor
MPVELEQDVNGCALRLSGAVDIFEAQVLHGAATTAYAAGGPVTVRAEALESVDTSTTQILLALKRALGAGGRAFRMTDAPAGVLETWRRLALDGELP